MSEDNEPTIPKAYRRSYLIIKKIKEAGSNYDTRLDEISNSKDCIVQFIAP